LPRPSRRGMLAGMIRAVIRVRDMTGAAGRRSLDACGSAPVEGT
jgi:hypothetical protein